MTPNTDWMVQAECRNIPNPEILSGEARRRALVGRGRRPSRDEEIRRLNGLGWTTDAICVALGVSTFVVWRANSTPRGDAA